MVMDGGKLSATRGTIKELAAKENTMVVGGCAIAGRASGGFACNGQWPEVAKLSVEVFWLKERRRKERGNESAQG